jgi:hypothetical protein
MSSITIDRPFLKEFTKEAEKALVAVAEQFGISASYKSGSFARDGANATLKFEIVAPDAETGETLSREAQEFKSLGHVFGFEPDDLGREFTVRRTVYKISGLKSSRPKYPISVVRVSDGKGFKFPEGTVKSALNIAPKFTKTSEGLSDEIKREFSRLVGELSPENLTCDGECSGAEVRRRRINITRQWKELERRAGLTVSEDQAWGFSGGGHV